MNKRVKELRISKKLTQKQFGEMIGLKQNSIALIENGKRNMSDSAVIALLSAFPDVNPDWFLYGSGEMFLPLTTELVVAAEIGALINGAGIDYADLKLECIHEILNFTDFQWEDIFACVARCVGGVGKIADHVAKNRRENMDDYETKKLSDLHAMLDIIIESEVCARIKEREQDEES